MKKYSAKDIYQLWFAQNGRCTFVSCVTQSFYASMQVMLQVFHIIVNVTIFQICRKIFALEYIFSKTHHVFPTIGMCIVYEKSRDLQRSTSNHHMYLCEMSPHMIYKYCLMMVWLVIILNIIVSTLGVLVTIFRLSQKFFWQGENASP